MVTLVCICVFLFRKLSMKVCLCGGVCRHQLTGQICSSLRSCGSSHSNVECDSVCVVGGGEWEREKRESAALISV